MGVINLLENIPSKYKIENSRELLIKLRHQYFELVIPVGSKTKIKVT